MEKSAIKAPYAPEAAPMSFLSLSDRITEIRNSVAVIDLAVEGLIPIKNTHPAVPGLRDLCERVMQDLDILSDEVLRHREEGPVLRGSPAVRSARNQ